MSLIFIPDIGKNKVQQIISREQKTSPLLFLPEYWNWSRNTRSLIPKTHIGKDGGCVMMAMGKIHHGRDYCRKDKPM